MFHRRIFSFNFVYVEAKKQFVCGKKEPGEWAGEYA